MGIYDWKKVRAVFPSTYRWKKWTGTMNKYVDIWGPSYTHIDYIVWTSRNRDFRFKTKKRALKFAKEYMGKH